MASEAEEEEGATFINIEVWWDTGDDNEEDDDDHYDRGKWDIFQE